MPSPQRRDRVRGSCNWPGRALPAVGPRAEGQARLRGRPHRASPHTGCRCGPPPPRSPPEALPADPVVLALVCGPRGHLSRPRSLRAAAKPRAGCRNVFLIFIVHSVTDVCAAIIVILCTCVVMKWVSLKLCQVIFSPPFRNPNILFLPMFQLVCHASLFYFKDPSGRQSRAGLPALLMGRRVAFDLGLCSFLLTLLFCRHTQPTCMLLE